MPVRSVGVMAPDAATSAWSTRYLAFHGSRIAMSLTARTRSHSLAHNMFAAGGTKRLRWLQGKNMDLLILVIVLLLLFGGGGGLYWGMGMGWGIGPIGLIIAAVVIAYQVYGYRVRRGRGA